MTTLIVNALFREQHSLHQQVNTVEERVTDLETSANSKDPWIAALEADEAFCCNLMEVYLCLDNGENRNRQNNLRLRGISTVTMGPDLPRHSGGGP